MTAFAFPTTTAFSATVARHANTLKEQLRFWRARAPIQQRTNSQASEIAKKVLSSEKSAAVEHVVGLVVDLAQRGSLADAESVGLSLAAIARAEWAAAHPAQRRVQLSREEAAIAEEQAEGVMESAETVLHMDPTNQSKRLALLAASATYKEALRIRDEVERALAMA